MRKLKFQIGNYYHIYNRGVDKRNIFLDDKDYRRFLICLKEFNTLEPIESLYRLNQVREKEKVESKSLQFCRDLDSTIIKIICYSLLNNHFHLILEQTTKNGIEKFMQKIGIGYTMYFNNKYDRSGSLFQGTYKSVRINSDFYLNYLSAYINGNSEIHKLAKAEKWIWSSHQDYLDLRQGILCDKKIILSQFENIKVYKDYVSLVIKESKKRKDDIHPVRYSVLLDKACLTKQSSNGVKQYLLE
jgi:putative transposase